MKRVITKLDKSKVKIHKEDSLYVVTLLTRYANVQEGKIMVGNTPTKAINGMRRHLEGLGHIGPILVLDELCCGKDGLI